MGTESYRPASKSLYKLVEEYLEPYPKIPDYEAQFLSSLISSFEELNREIFVSPDKGKHDWYQLCRLSFALVWSGDSQAFLLSAALHRMFHHWKGYALPAGTLFLNPEVTAGSIITNNFKDLLKMTNVSSRNWI